MNEAIPVVEVGRGCSGDLLGAMACQNGGFGGNMGIWFLFLLIALGGFGGFGGFGRGGAPGAGPDLMVKAATDTAEIKAGVNYAAQASALTNSKLETMGNGICSLGYTNATLANGINMNLANYAAGVNSAIAGLAQQNSECCCGIKQEILGGVNTLSSAIAQLNYNSAVNAQTITAAIHADGEATRALLNQNMIQSLRDSLNEVKLKQTISDAALAAQNSCSC